MGTHGELFPGSKLKHEGGHGTAGREHDPGGPLDLERGVVFLAPPSEDHSKETTEDDDSEARPPDAPADQ